MKWLQNGNLAKLVAFFVIATVMSCTVSFAAGGWQSFVDDGVSSDSAPSDGDVTGKDENTDLPDTDVPVAVPVQKYYHCITGLETGSNELAFRPMCFVFSSSDPLYGISSSYLTIEIPTEYGNTRLLCFTDDAKTLGKIGSIAPTRGYISSFASYFGGILLSYGTDDKIEYVYSEPNYRLDFSDISGYCYTEYNSFIYTNADLVNAFATNSKIDQSLTDRPVLPYAFSGEYENFRLNGESAQNVSITYSEANFTQLSFSTDEDCYFLTKSNGLKTDLLNDKSIKYDNVFLLYADSTTHESENTTQLVMDTYTKGSGIYLNKGEYVEITWEQTAPGVLTFYDGNGEKLVVNRGTSYISIVKSSLKSTVKIS